MRLPLAVISTAMLGPALALTGCGGSGAGSATPAVQVPFKSAAIAARSIPARYTCDGKNVHPPLEWGAVPADTRELVLLAVGLVPTGTGYYSASMEWALAGVKPGLHRLAAGQVPPGAYAGVAAKRKASYSICPQKGVSEHYQFMLYAIPVTAKVLPPRFTGFQVLAAVSKPGTASSAVGKGVFVAAYKRRR